MKPTFFVSPAEWRVWLAEHHQAQEELWVGFYKRDSGRPSITWPEAVDGALCFGWIDGVRKSLDEASYVIRFTPRRSRSVWSALNIRRFEELTHLGLVRPAGLQAFQRRSAEPSEIYAYEQRKGAKPTGDYLGELLANKKAWKFFRTQPPWYQRTASWWVVSGKREKTRLKRLSELIRDSEQGRAIKQLRRPGGKK